MTNHAAPSAIAVTRAIEAVMRNDRGRLIAASDATAPKR
jgi:hypothetical protein